MFGSFYLICAFSVAKQNKPGKECLSRSLSVLQKSSAGSFLTWGFSLEVIAFGITASLD